MLSCSASVARDRVVRSDFGSHEALATNQINWLMRERRAVGRLLAGRPKTLKTLNPKTLRFEPSRLCVMCLSPSFAALLFTSESLNPKP